MHPLSLNDIIKNATEGMEKISGECPTHGPQDVFRRPGIAEWRCPACAALEASAKAVNELAEERRAAMHKHACIPARYKGQRFTPHTEAHKAARTLAKTFFDDVVLRISWRALVLTGEPGTGKTLLASEIAERFIDKAFMTARYTTAMGMISEIQSVYGNREKSEDQAIQRFADYKLLILDEIDQLRDKDNTRLILTEVVNRRYNADLPIIVISNKPRGELVQYVGERIDDRLCENAVHISFDWPSFRRNAPTNGG